MFTRLVTHMHTTETHLNVGMMMTALAFGPIGVCCTVCADVCVRVDLLREASLVCWRRAVLNSVSWSHLHLQVLVQGCQLDKIDLDDFLHHIYQQLRTLENNIAHVLHQHHKQVSL